MRIKKILIFAFGFWWFFQLAHAKDKKPPIENTKRFKEYLKKLKKFENANFLKSPEYFTYRDYNGGFYNWGFGFHVNRNIFLKKSWLPNVRSYEELLKLADKELHEQVKEKIKQLIDCISSYRELPTPLQIVLFDMIYNMGKSNFCTFKKMREAITKKDWKRAYTEYKDSKYFRSQLPLNKARFKFQQDLWKELLKNENF